MSSPKSVSSSDNADRVPGDRGVEVAEPLPWSWEQVHDGGGNPLPEYEISANVDPEHIGFHVATVFQASRASLIVRAVNCHDDLVAALEHIVGIPKNVPGGIITSDALIAIVAIARSALAKARAS